MSEAYLFVFTTLASTEGFVLAALLIGGWLLLSQRVRESTTLLLCAAGMMASVQGLKEWLQIPRPSAALIETVGYAFPSGHAAGAFFLALCVCVLTPPGSSRPFVCTFALIAAALISLSRLQLGVHTPLQVGVGILVGLAWVLVWLCLRTRH